MTDPRVGAEPDAAPDPAELARLTEPEIEELVARYLLEMARYEFAAAEVGARLRRELRAGALLRHVISFRAKHPEDLREKLRDRSGSNPAYTIQALRRNMNDVVTDLAGCRVLVYTPEDEARVIDIVDRAFALPPRKDARPEPARKDTGYRATHRLVYAPASEEQISIQGAICEVQVTTVAAHLFNELEHDITYKHHGRAPSEDEKDVLQRVRRLGEVLDEQVGALVLKREAARRAQEAITTAEALRFILEHDVGRPLNGDFYRLHQMLDSTVSTLTRDAIVALGGQPAEILQRGQATAAQLGIGDPDDVTCFVLGLEDLRGDFVWLASSWRGRRTPLRRAIELWASQALDLSHPVPQNEDEYRES